MWKIKEKKSGILSRYSGATSQNQNEYLGIGNLSEFVAYSNFTDEHNLLEVFAKMPATGVQYILYNLKNERKFDVTSDPFDVRVLSPGVEGDGQQPSLAPCVGQASGAKVRNARRMFPLSIPNRPSAI